MQVRYKLSILRPLDGYSAGTDRSIQERRVQAVTEDPQRDSWERIYALCPAGLLEHIPVRPGIGWDKTTRRSQMLMEVDLIFKIAAIGILVAVLNQLLVRSGRDEQAMMTTLTGLVVVLMILVEKISDLFQLIKLLFEF